MTEQFIKLKKLSEEMNKNFLCFDKALEIAVQSLKDVYMTSTDDVICHKVYEATKKINVEMKKRREEIVKFREEN